MKTRLAGPLSIVTLFLFAVAIGGQAQEWSRFRGPNGTGISHAKTIPAKWTEQDINWRAALPGTGHSSPVLWGDKIFLTSTDQTAGGITAHCVAAKDGKILWSKPFELRPYRQHKFNSFASPSAAADEERVYFCWATPEQFTLLAMSHAGEKIWERNLGPYVSQHGPGVSPIVYEDLVVLPNDQDGVSFLIAVNRKTGETKWKVPRRSGQAAYSTPCVYQPKGEKPLLIFNSHAHGISGVDPSSGETVWEFDKAFDKRSVSSPVLASGLFIGSCGSGGGGNYVVAVKPGSADKKKKPELAFDMRKSSMAPYVPCSLAYNDLLFLWSDAGFLSCIHAPTGEIKYQERVGGNFFSSPIIVDGRIFGVSTSGEVVVVEASDRFRELARNQLGEATHATPAVAGGRLYIRTLTQLFSIGGEKISASNK